MKPAPSRLVRVSNYLQPDQDLVQVRAWPISTDDDRCVELHGRVTVSIDTGASTTYLRATKAECRQLIDMLFWALQEATPADAPIPLPPRPSFLPRRAGPLDPTDPAAPPAALPDRIWSAS